MKGERLKESTLCLHKPCPSDVSTETEVRRESPVKIGDSGPMSE